MIRHKWKRASLALAASFALAASACAAPRPPARSPASDQATSPAATATATEQATSPLATPTSEPTSLPTASATAESTPPEMAGSAIVNSIELLTLESFPVQINAIVRGDLSDACTTIASTEQQRDENEFQITLVTTRPVDAMCAQVITPFEQTVGLEVVGLPAGTYTVTVGSLSEPFTLNVDNVLPAIDATPTVTSTTN